jgi:hypothetical protein
MSQMVEIDGKQVEVLSAEEQQAKIDAEIEKYKTEHPAGDVATLLEKEKEIKELNDKLSKLNDKDFNFANVRKQLEEKETELKKYVNEKVDEKQSKEMTQKIDANVLRLSGGDAELEKKIRFHLGRLSDVVENDKQAAEKVISAYKLATAKEVDLFSDSNPLGPGIANNTGGGTQGGKIPEHLTKVAKEFGISDEDAKKYNL